MLDGRRIVVVMPAYRAGRTLEATVRDLPKDVVDDVVLVDDASDDDTVAIARSLGLAVLLHPMNRVSGYETFNYDGELEAALGHGALIASNTSSICSIGTDENATLRSSALVAIVPTW